MREAYRRKQRGTPSATQVQWERRQGQTTSEATEAESESESELRVRSITTGTGPVENECGRPERGGSGRPRNEQENSPQTVCAGTNGGTNGKTEDTTGGLRPEYFGGTNV